MSNVDDYLDKIEKHATVIASSAHVVDCNATWLSWRYEFTTPADSALACAEMKLADALKTVREARQKMNALKEESGHEARDSVARTAT